MRTNAPVNLNFSPATDFAGSFQKPWTFPSEAPWARGLVPLDFPCAGFSETQMMATPPSLSLQFGGVKNMEALKLDLCSKSQPCHFPLTWSPGSLTSVFCSENWGEHSLFVRLDEDHRKWDGKPLNRAGLSTQQPL